MICSPESYESRDYSCVIIQSLDSMTCRLVVELSGGLALGL